MSTKPSRAAPVPPASRAPTDRAEIKASTEIVPTRTPGKGDQKEAEKAAASKKAAMEAQAAAAAAKIAEAAASATTVVRAAGRSLLGREPKAPTPSPVVAAAKGQGAAAEMDSPPDSPREVAAGEHDVASSPGSSRPMGLASHLMHHRDSVVSLGCSI